MSLTNMIWIGTRHRQCARVGNTIHSILSFNFNEHIYINKSITTSLAYMYIISSFGSVQTLCSRVSYLSSVEEICERFLS